jgi:uncharacterized protein
MHPRRATLWAWLLALAAFFITLGAAAQDVLPVPALSGRVIDQTGTLSSEQRSGLEAQLAAVEAQRGAQIVVLMVASTQPEDVASFAQRVGEAWKIGRRNVGDGLLIVVAKNDRHLRIEVAKSLEGAVPDLAARQIIDQALKPAFRNGDYAGGLGAAITLLDKRIAGEGLPLPSARESRGNEALDGLNLQDIGMFLFIAVPVVATLITRVFGRKLGALLSAGGAGALAWWFSASVLLSVVAAVATLVVVGILGFGGGGGGSWGGGGGGGGFSSGGGGDFGGGGASGDW